MRGAGAGALLVGALGALGFGRGGLGAAAAAAAGRAGGGAVPPLPLFSCWCTFLFFLLVFGPGLRLFLVLFVSVPFSFHLFFFFPLEQLVSVVFNLFLKTLAWLLGSFPRL